MPSVPTTLVSSPANPYVSRPTVGPSLVRRTPLKSVRRRPNRAQGRALEVLAHAIEYLADTELHAGHGVFSGDLLGATEILMERSRTVFAECKEVNGFGQTLQQGLIRMFGRPTLIVPPTHRGSWPTDSLTR
ncbi:MAG: hypothetical protein NVSMB62_01380 [Acidobacteriaceae bacterium]